MQLIKSDGINPGALFLDGHFPGNPIVPGAVFLGLAQQALREIGYEIRRIQRMKFLRQLGPDQPFEITAVFNDRTANLTWISAGEALASARVELCPCHD